MAPSETKFKVAAVHASPIFMNKSATLAKVISLIEQAASEQVRFLAFPETFVPGYPYFIECYPPITQAPGLSPPPPPSPRSLFHLPLLTHLQLWQNTQKNQSSYHPT